MAATLSVRDMIDAALGSTYGENIVNFKMLQNVLHVLAQQLRVLERQVELRDGGDSSSHSSNVSVTEVQIEATTGSKGKAKDTMLVVERGGTKDTDYARINHGRVSVVTQSQFAKLEALVHEMLKNQNIVPRVSSVIPPNDQAIADIRRGNLSLPDAMATMHIAARVDATERGIEKLAELLTELASTTGMTVDDNIRLDLPKHGHSDTGIPGRSNKNVKTDTQESSKPAEASAKSPIRELRRKSIFGGNLVVPDTDNFVTTDDLTNANKELQAQIKRTVGVAEQRLRTSTDLIMAKILTLEQMMSDLTRVDERISTVENNIDEYSKQLNSLDAGLSNQMYGFQEHINELQSGLEAGLQQAMESATAGGDTAALAEISTKLACLVTDFDEATTSLHMLEDETKTIIVDLRVLLEQIELLKRDKVDREETIDALRDKANKSALNGMVAETYFEAVRASIDSKQKYADEKFRQCEVVWAGAIDDLHDELNDKAEKIELEPLRDYIDGRLADMLKHIQEVIKVVGEPRAAGVSRRWVRDTECIACSAPAVLREERMMVPRLPEAAVQGVRPPVIGAEYPENNKFMCHAEWPTSTHLCQRYCGGSHTMMPAGVVTHSSFAKSMKVSPALRRVAPGEGTDGQLYMTEEMIAKRTCTPCNPPPPPGSRTDTLQAAIE